MKPLCVVLLAFVQTILANTVHISKEYTVKIEPGTMECYYENIRANQIIDVEYQVIDGGHGDLDVDFELTNPQGYLMVHDSRKSDNIQRVTAEYDGDHRFCFDNSFSTFSSKTVFFEIIVESESEGDHNEDEWGREVLDHATPDQLVDIKIENIQEILTHLHTNLNRMKHDLDIRRSLEARDRNVAEESNWRVGTWSLFQIILMVIVGAIQVYMLRSLFETDPRANIWKKFKVFN